MFTDEELAVIEALAPYDKLDQVYYQRHEILPSVTNLSVEL